MPAKKGRRLGRRILLSVGLLLAVVVVLVALAPTMVNWGVGRGAIRRAVQRNVNGEVAIGRLRVGWFGDQSIDGLTVTDEQGLTAAALNVRLEAGLLSLLTGTARTFQVDLAGSLEGRLNEDGSTSFEDLLVRAPGADTAAGGGGSGFDRIPQTTLKIDSVSIRLREAGSGNVVELNDLAGTVVYDPGRGVDIDVAGVTSDGRKNGSLTLTAGLLKPFDEKGALRLDRASGTLTLTVTDTPVPLARQRTEIRSLTVTATSEDLTDALDLSIAADAAIEGRSAGTLSGEITVHHPVAADGTVQVGLDQLTGQVIGTGVPTALGQRFLRDTPIIAQRDIGPTIDVDARFGSGQRRTVQITASAAAGEVSFAGTVDSQDRSVQGESLSLNATVSPELLGEVTGLHFDRPAQVGVQLDSFSAAGDAYGAAGSASFDQATADFDLALDGGALSGELVGRLIPTAPLAPLLEGTPIDLARDVGPTMDVDVRIEPGPAALSRLTVTTGAGAMSLSGVVDPRTRSIRGESIELSARLDPALVQAAAGVTIDGPADVRVELDELSVPAWAGAAAFPLGGIGLSGTASLAGPLSVSPGRETGPVTIERVVVELAAQSLAGAVEVHGSAFVNGAAAETDFQLSNLLGSPLRVTDGRASAMITPQLLAAVQPAGAAPVSLAGPVRVTITTEPFDATGPINATIAAGDMVLKGVPGLIEPLGVRELAADVTARPGKSPRAAVKASARLRRAADDRGLAWVQCAFTATRGDPVELEAISVDVSELSVADLDAMRGDAADLAPWVGDRGSVKGTVDLGEAGSGASLHAEFPRLKGDIVAALQGDMVSVTAKDARWVLGAAALEKRLKPVRVAADVPTTLQIRTLLVPRAMLDGGRFDPAAVKIDVLLAGGPLVLVDPQEGRSTLDKLNASVTSSDLADGLAFSVKGDVASRDGSEPGAIDIDGTVAGLVTDRVLTPEGARLEMSARVKNLQTAVVDGAADLGGMLVAAVGRRIDGSADASKLSRTSGDMVIHLDTPNGRLDARVRGDQDGLSISADEPTTATLAMTEPFRQQVLYRIHPLLADISKTDERLRATVTSGSIPLDGDVSRLDAELRLDVGNVLINRKSPLLSVMTLTGAPPVPGAGGQVMSTIPAVFEPINVQIKKGIISYKRFALRIDEFTMAYSGTINLVTGWVQLKTEVPLRKLAVQVKELRQSADELFVPVYIRGTLGSPLGVKIDEQELALALAKAGAKGALQEELDKQGIPIDVGGILDEIFGGKKKK